MKQLVTEWDETCDLSIFDQGEVFYIEIVRGTRALTISAAVGQRLPVHATASGKLFLAYLPEVQVSNILSQPMKTFTEKTVTSPDGIRAQLEEIRRQGYALDYEEFEHGVCAIAAPIFNRSGNIIAAIGGPSPMSRMTPERIQQIAEAFMEAAKGISHRMGYRS